MSSALAITQCREGIDEDGTPNVVLVPVDLPPPETLPVLCEYSLQEIAAPDPRFAKEIHLSPAAADLVEAGKLTLHDTCEDHPITGELVPRVCLDDSPLESIRSFFTSMECLGLRGTHHSQPGQLKPWEMMAVLQEIQTNANFLPHMIAEFRAMLDVAGHKPPEWFVKAEADRQSSELSPCRIEGETLDGDSLAPENFPNLAEAQKSLHERTLLRIRGQLPPVKREAIV